MPKAKAQGKSSGAPAAKRRKPDDDDPLDASKTAALEALLKPATTERTVKKGEALIKSGVSCQSIYYVLDGTLALRKAGGDHLADAIALGKGSVLGELELLLGCAPAVDAVAKGGSVKVAELKVSSLLKLLSDDPCSGSRLFIALAAKLARKVDLMNSMLQ